MSTLLVTRGLYERGKKFIIQGGQPSAVIEADQLVESTANFERFRYLLRTL
jgi:guanyl-specific ribonuclease Sa